MTVDAKGEILELKNTINSMTDTLATFADQSPASPARSASRANSAARLRCPAPPARGAI